MRYVAHFLVGAGLLMSLVGVINYSIDPFELWGAPRIAGVSTAKSVGNVRFAKPLQVEMRDPATVILGSSRAQVGIDPRDFPVAERAYNFGLPAATAAEMKGYAAHILADTDARRLIIGLDFFSFNDASPAIPTFDDAFLGRNAVLRATPMLLFSLAALERSRRTILNSRKRGASDYRADGFSIFPLDLTKDPESVFLANVREFVEAGYLYGSYRSFERSSADFRVLLAAARSKGIAVDLYISPEHVSLLEAADRVGLWPVYKDWKRRLTVIAAEFAMPLWDFSGYNEVTTTPLNDGFRTHFDASHFRPEIGRRIIARLHTAGGEDGFGTRLTPQNIERCLTALDAARAAYRHRAESDAARVTAVVDALVLRP